MRAVFASPAASTLWAIELKGRKFPCGAQPYELNALQHYGLDTLSSMSALEIREGGPVGIHIIVLPNVPQPLAQRFNCDGWWSQLHKPSARGAMKIAHNVVSSNRIGALADIHAASPAAAVGKDKSFSADVLSGLGL